MVGYAQKAGGSGVQYCPWLYKELWACLGYMRPCLQEIPRDKMEKEPSVQCLLDTRLEGCFSAGRKIPLAINLSYVLYSLRCWVRSWKITLI